MWRHLKACHKPTFIHLKETLNSFTVQKQLPVVPARAGRAEREQLNELFVQWLCRRGRPAAIVNDPELQQIVAIASLGRHAPPSVDTVPLHDLVTFFALQFGFGFACACLALHFMSGMPGTSGWVGLSLAL